MVTAKQLLKLINSTRKKLGCPASETPLRRLENSVKIETWVILVSITDKETFRVFPSWLFGGMTFKPMLRVFTMATVFDGGRSFRTQSPR